MSCTEVADHGKFPTAIPMGSSMTLTATETCISKLVQLPDEILLGVVRYITLKRDLLNLSLACRKLENVAVKALYERMDIHLSAPRSAYQSRGCRTIAYRQHVFDFVQDLTVRSGNFNSADAASVKEKTSDRAANDYICDILQRLPLHQLRSFALLHQMSLTTEILRLLATDQNHHLEDLRFYATDSLSSDAMVPRNLRRLQCRSVQSGEALGRLIEANQDTLESLHIGQEKDLVDNYRRSRMSFLEQIAEVPSPLTQFLTCNRLTRLRHLRLVGLDLGSLPPRTSQSQTFLWQLEALTIESCGGVAQFLDTLSAAFHHIRTSRTTTAGPALLDFTFRHEALSGHTKNALIDFLGSFAGLTKLALLLENATLVERPATFIAEHGRTLESLVIETRIQPREHLGLDTSRPLGVGDYIHQLWQQSINDICELCPNLVELGMGFPWDDEMIRLKKTKLSTLRKLKTVHIRNFPQSQVLSQIGDYAIQEHARRFIEWSFPSLVGSDRPGLETLAIGPTLYESRWKYTSGPANSPQSCSTYRRYFNPPEYLRTHYFCLDWARTRFGRWHAMITPVTEKCMEEMRDEAPLEGIFEHVWLR